MSKSSFIYLCFWKNWKFHLPGDSSRDLFIPKRWRSPVQPFKRVTWTHHPKKGHKNAELPGSSSYNMMSTPLKINGWNIIMEVWFRSFSFLPMGDLWVPAVNLPGSTSGTPKNHGVFQVSWRWGAFRSNGTFFVKWFYVFGGGNGKSHTIHVWSISLGFQTPGEEVFGPQKHT